MKNSEPCVKDEEPSVHRFWLGLTDDPVQRVVHDGYLYIIFDPETMMNTGSALHRVCWIDPGRPEGEYRLIPQGKVPDWIRDRLPDNTSSLEYLDK